MSTENIFIGNSYNNIDKKVWHTRCYIFIFVKLLVAKIPYELKKCQNCRQILNNPTTYFTVWRQIA